MTAPRRLNHAQCQSSEETELEERGRNTFPHNTGFRAAQVRLPAFARFVGAPEPLRMSETEAAAIVGEDVVYYTMKLSGSSYAKAKRVLAWKPRRLEWLAA